MDYESAARRNLFLLAAGMAALYGMVELAVGVATLTFEATGGSRSLAGFAPAVFVGCSALAAVPAGRAMDRSGRRPILIAGFAVGAAGCLLAGLGVSAGSLAVAMLGFALAGIAAGTVLLSRAAGADMFPPERRPRAIALVLFGAVFGALLGPLVFGPLLGDGHEGLDLAWVGAAAFMLVGLAIASRLRPDPQEIARALDAGPGVAEPSPAEGLRLVLGRPGVAPAVVAILAVWGAMIAIMVLTGTAMVDHGHPHGSIFPVLTAHFVGMFGLFAVVGPAIERIGRTPALVGGLVLLAASAAALVAAIASVALTALALFGVGLGWSLAFVAATAELSERSRPAERATLIGFSDLLGGITGGALAIAGGIGLEHGGLAAVALAAAALPLAAAVWIVRDAKRARAFAGARA
ncbi:MAG TPA: MFS transporter [Solirubrobacterales bacterium]|nr:MFS transporter [Solirubrobacterales bacterium]